MLVWEKHPGQFPGGSSGELLLNGYIISFWGDENILGFDSGDSCKLHEYTKNHWIEMIQWC